MEGEVYRLRTPSRLREGLTDEELDGSVEIQFVSTTISAVSYITLICDLFLHLFLYIPFHS